MPRHSIVDAPTRLVRPPSLRRIVDNIQRAEAVARLWNYNCKLWEDSLPLPWRVPYHLAVVIFYVKLGDRMEEQWHTIPRDDYLAQAWGIGPLAYVILGGAVLIGWPSVRDALGL
jgi:hypothetical protein